MKKDEVKKPVSSETKVETIKYNDALQLAWARYKVYDATAMYLMNSLIRAWRLKLLYFSITGAFLGVLSGTVATTHVPSEYTQIFEIAAQVLAFLSTICVTFAAFAGSEILTDQVEKSGINARAIAESLQSEIYKFIFKVGEYHSYRDSKLFDKVENIISNFPGIELTTIDRNTELKGILQIDLNINQYISNRVEDQIDWFNRKTKDYQNKIKFGKKITFSLGFLGIVLGALGTAGFSAYTSVWVAFATAAAASVASYLSTNKFQYLIISYQTTSNRLKTILAKYKSEGQKEGAAQLKFINEIETELNRENQAWIEEHKRQMEEKEDLKAQLLKPQDENGAAITNSTK